MRRGKKAKGRAIAPKQSLTLLPLFEKPNSTSLVAFHSVCCQFACVRKEMEGPVQKED